MPAALLGVLVWNKQKIPLVYSVIPYVKDRIKRTIKMQNQANLPAQELYRQLPLQLFKIKLLQIKEASD
jgi:hypothetical protein